MWSNQSCVLDMQSRDVSLKISRADVMNLFDIADNISFCDTNNIGIEGVKYLKEGNFSQLTILDLSFNQIGNKGAKYIIEGTFSKLTNLNLERNKIESQKKEKLKTHLINGGLVVTALWRQ